MLWLPLLAVFAAPAVQVTIDPSKIVGDWEPRLLGGNLIGYQMGSYGDVSPVSTDRSQGMWDPIKAAPEPGMVALAKEAGMKVGRYPGGCAAHLFDWKKAVGPLSKRPHQLFGVPEYLRLCEAIGAEPLITISDYHGDAKEAAELVEYLNAPADIHHPWAKLRADDGHPAPWKVKWFEYGNETEHGPHLDNSGKTLRKPMTAEEYGRNYLAYQAAMKAVDPSIRLGAVLATAFPDLTQWCRTVLKTVGTKADFGIHHSYLPSYSGGRQITSRFLFENAWAVADQIDRYYSQIQSEAKRAGYVQGLPIAVTEFNGGFVQEEPVPYRHTLGNALGVAEMIRVFTNPAHRIFMANFWEFPNEYWGQVKGFPSQEETLVRRPQFFPHQFFAKCMKGQLIAAKVEGDSYATEGDSQLGVEPHGGGERVSLPGPEREARRAVEPFFGGWHSATADLRRARRSLCEEPGRELLSRAEVGCGAAEHVVSLHRVDQDGEADVQQRRVLPGGRSSRLGGHQVLPDHQVRDRHPGLAEGGGRLPDPARYDRH